jgi:hypothetical protein
MKDDWDDVMFNLKFWSAVAVAVVVINEIVELIWD